MEVGGRPRRRRRHFGPRGHRSHPSPRVQGVLLHTHATAQCSFGNRTSFTGGMRSRLRWSAGYAGGERCDSEPSEGSGRHAKKCVRACARACVRKRMKAGVHARTLEGRHVSFCVVLNHLRNINFSALDMLAILLLRDSRCPSGPPERPVFGCDSDVTGLSAVTGFSCANLPAPTQACEKK